MDEGDFIPISLTSCLSKVLEDFVVTWLIDDVKDKIDPNQFGRLRGTSTTYCLLDMIHTWLTYLDLPGRHPRLCLLDFPKAWRAYWVQCTHRKASGLRRSHNLNTVDYKLCV